MVSLIWSSSLAGGGGVGGAATAVAGAAAALVGALVCWGTGCPPLLQPTSATAASSDIAGPANILDPTRTSANPHRRTKELATHVIVANRGRGGSHWRGTLAAIAVTNGTTSLPPAEWHCRTSMITLPRTCMP